MLIGNLPSIIFDQFLQIVEKLSQHACFVFNKCDFDFRVYEKMHHRLLDVLYVVEDECKRQHEVVATIDITNICLDYLTSCKWVAYLERIAVQFVHDICPPKIAVVKQSKPCCRQEPPRCELLPCKHVTTVIKKKIPIVPREECEVIIQDCCECVPECPLAPPCVKKQVIVQYEQEKPHKCCGKTVYEKPNHKRHDFAQHKGTTDYNHHVWNKQCHCKTGCPGVKAH